LTFLRNIVIFLVTNMLSVSFLKSHPVDETTRDDSMIRVYRRHVARAISEERWHVAEIFLDRILDVDPRHTEAWLMKGFLRHHCHEDGLSAVECYRKVITLCGHDLAHPHAQRAHASLNRLLSAWG
jgi:regulator of sirC expression with transglutaminase-like and TPR domain